MTEYSESPLDNLIVPALKSDGSLQMCIDYRKVTEVTRERCFQYVLV